MVLVNFRPWKLYWECWEILGSFRCKLCERILLSFTTAEWNIGWFGFTEEQGNAKLFVDRRTVSAPFLERILFVQQHGGFYGLCEAKGYWGDGLETPRSGEKKNVWWTHIDGPLCLGKRRWCPYSTDDFETENVDACMERGVWERDRKWRDSWNNCISQRDNAARPVRGEFVGSFVRDHEFWSQRNLRYLGTEGTHNLFEFLFH